jgi:hypothetical protein
MKSSDKRMVRTGSRPLEGRHPLFRLDSTVPALTMFLVIRRIRNEKASKTSRAGTKTGFGGLQCIKRTPMPDTEKAEKPFPKKRSRPVTPDTVPIRSGVGLESPRSIHC